MIKTYLKKNFFKLSASCGFLLLLSCSNTLTMQTRTTSPSGGIKGAIQPKITDAQGKTLRQELLNFAKTIKKQPPNEQVNKMLGATAEKALLIREVQLADKNQQLSDVSKLKSGFNFDSTFLSAKKARALSSPAGSPPGSEGKLELLTTIANTANTTNASAKQIKTYLSYVLKLESSVNKPSKRTTPDQAKAITQKYAMLANILAKKGASGAIDVSQSQKEVTSIKALSERLGTGDFNFLAEFTAASRMKDLTQQMTTLTGIVKNPNFKYVTGDKTSTKYANNLINLVRKLESKIYKSPNAQDGNLYGALLTAVRTKFQPTDLAQTSPFKKLVELSNLIGTGDFIFMKEFNSAKKEKIASKQFATLLTIVTKIPANLPEKYANALFKLLKLAFNKQIIKGNPTPADIASAKQVFAIAVTKPQLKPFDKKQELVAINQQLQSGMILEVELNKIKKADITTQIATLQKLLPAPGVITTTKQQKLVASAVLKTGKAIKKEFSKTPNQMKKQAFESLIKLASAKIPKYAKNFQKSLDALSAGMLKAELNKIKRAAPNTQISAIQKLIPKAASQSDGKLIASAILNVGKTLRKQFKKQPNPTLKNQYISLVNYAKRNPNIAKYAKNLDKSVQVFAADMQKKVKSAQNKVEKAQKNIAKIDKKIQQLDVKYQKAQQTPTKRSSKSTMKNYQKDRQKLLTNRQKAVQQFQQAQQEMRAAQQAAR